MRVGLVPLMISLLSSADVAEKKNLDQNKCKKKQLDISFVALNKRLTEKLVQSFLNC